MMSSNFQNSNDDESSEWHTERVMGALEDLHRKATAETSCSIINDINNIDDDYDEYIIKEEEVMPNLSTGSRLGMKQVCFPHNSISYKEYLPSICCVIAFALTGEGSWDCKYFQGATISFTGNNYGLWSIEDTFGQCTLYDVLFFSYMLDPSLKAARFFSMIAMVLGLALTVVSTQALQFHAASWAVGAGLICLFFISVTTAKTFNLWAVFFIFTYVIFILIARFLFIHPVRRRISQRGTKLISFLFGLCCICTTLTLVVLHSEFCTCRNITADRLEGREPGTPCAGECSIGIAGGVMMTASAFWLLGSISVWKYGLQPTELKQDNDQKCKHLAHYPTQSLTSRVLSSGYFKKQLDEARTATSLGGSSSQSSKSKLNDDNINHNIIEDGHSCNNESNNNREEEQQQCETNNNNNNINRNDVPTIVDTRSRGQKCCFDYRVTKRTTTEKIGFWLFRTALGFLVAIYVFIIILFSGTYQENTDAARSPDTSYNFITDIVCAYNPLNPSEPFQTFPTKFDAITAGYVVAHCGECGYCSNPHDIRTYVETRKTIAKSAKKCGPRAIFGKYEKLVDCLEDKINFTRDCTECWADNMENTAKHCMLTCLTTLFTGQMTSNNVDGAGGDTGIAWLNQCLFCDEKRSGPEFVKCSGVARRRLGIHSEIIRNPKEQCTNVDFDWLTINWNDKFPNLT